MADPISASITAIVTAVASSLGASAATAATIATITTAAVQTAAVIAAVSAARPKVDANGSPIQWRADPDAPIPFLHGGPLKVAGTIVARKAFGPENMYQGIVSVVSGAGPVAGPVSWEVERQPITFDGTQKAAAPYGDKLWLSYQVGAQPTTTALQSPPGLRAGADMPGWATTAKLSGKAAYMVTLGHDSKGKIWTRGEPEFGGVWQGLGCWDPRADSTYPGGAGTQRYDQPTTWTYTNNPILNGLRWAMGEWEGPNGGVPYLDKLVGGMGLTLDEIDVVSFVEGANVADALGLTMAGLATTDDDKWQVLSAMLQAGGCAPITVDGKLTCMVRVAARTSVLTLARGDITGAIEMVRSPSRLERINTVIPRYRSEAHDWEMVSADPVSRTEYVDEDGGVKRSRQIAYSYVTDLDQATMLAAYDIADAREGFVGGVPVMPYLRELRPGDAFTLPATDDLGPLSGKKMLLLSREFDPATGDLAFGVREETDGKHVWAGGLTGTVADPVTYDPPSLTFAAPDAADWSLSAGAGATPSVVLTGEVTNPLADAVLVEVMLDGGTVWSPGVTTDETNVELIEAPVPSGGAWLASVRYRSAQTQIWGDRLVLGPVTVSGVTIEPGDLDDAGVLRGTTGGLVGASAAEVGDAIDRAILGLDSDGVVSANKVETASVAPESLTPAFSALSNSAVTWGAETAEKDLQSVVVTVVRGRVIITFVADIGPATSATGWFGRLRLYRGATEITEAVRFIKTLPPSGGNYDLPSQMMLTHIDEPGAGTYTYKVTFATGDVVTVNVSNRSLICQVTEG